MTLVTAGLGILPKHESTYLIMLWGQQPQLPNNPLYLSVRVLVETTCTSSNFLFIIVTGSYNFLMLILKEVDFSAVL